MKRLLSALPVMMAVVAVPAIAADVGVSVQVGEPGFYGRIDIGNFPQPQVIYPRPVVIQPVPVGVVRPPIYLRVPAGHAKKWGKHCHTYNACGQPVYFVQDRWYNDVYVPRYRESHGRVMARVMVMTVARDTTMVIGKGTARATRTAE